MGRDGRFRPEYVVGGVVSGRWATRGGGALQIPRVLRRAVIADPGWVLVVADAAQLEPRVLAALAADHAFAEAAAAGDLYAALAGVFGGDRAKAKVALLSAMYGGAGRGGRAVAGRAAAAVPARLAVRGDRGPGGGGGPGGPVPAGPDLPAAVGRMAWADRARQTTRAAGRPGGGPGPARPRPVHPQLRGTGQRGRLGAGSARWPAPTAHGPGWGRAGRAALVFFQHDEVIVHCPEAAAPEVVAAVGEAAHEAGRLLFGATPVRFPMSTAVVACYADAK